MKSEIIYQTTLKNDFKYKGIALHSGKNISMRCIGADSGTGIVFVRTDLKGRTELKASAINAAYTSRSTGIGENGSIFVNAIEHLMAAFCIMEVDNAIVELDSGEVPAGDGSAALFAGLMEEAGVIRLDEAAEIISIKGPVLVEKGDAYIKALPYDGLRISYTLCYDCAGIGTQTGDYQFNKQLFFRDIAPARTFALAEEVEALHKAGLALGGSLENAVLFDTKGPVNSLRFIDEPLRHKMLDMLGDLYLNGRIRGHFTGVKSGHCLNCCLSGQIAEINKNRMSLASAGESRKNECISIIRR